MNSGDIRPTLMIAAAIVLAAVVVVFLVVSIILNYHWERYEISIARAKKARIVYLAASLVLLLVMAALFINIFS